MPTWSGRWKGGRYYLDELERPVYFIERRKRSVRLVGIHDETLAEAKLADFLTNPEGFIWPPPAPVSAAAVPVYLTPERMNLYLQSIRKACRDHYNARKSYLLAWSNYRDSADRALDLRSSTKQQWREALASFDGGHRGRVEALNAFARFLVAERDQGLDAWVPIENPYDPAPTRAAREAYTLEQLREGYQRLVRGGMLGFHSTKVRGACHPRTADVFLVRVATGLHQTEIDQLQGARVTKDPLPDQRVAAIRTLKGDQQIAGVLQVHHKNQHRHRVSVTRPVLEAALRLREEVPSRTAVLEAMKPLVPSNLRHTYETLAEDCGELVTYTGGGVPRSIVAQTMGHREGSTMIADHYNKTQIPPMIYIPLGFP